MKDSQAQVSVKSEENTQLHPIPTENDSEHNASSVVLLVTCISRSRFLTLSYDVNYSQTCIKPCLVPRPDYSARSMRFGSRNPSEEAACSPQIRHRNALTEKALGKRCTGRRQY